MTIKIFTTVKKILPLIGIIVFFYLIYSLGVEDITESVLSIPPIYILFACFLTIPRVFIRNIAWMLIHKEQKIKISYMKSLKIFLIGYFYGSISPGYLGQLMRIPYLKEKTGQPYGKLFVNSFIETTIHTLSLYTMMFVGALLVISVYPDLFIIVCIWIAALAVILTFFIRRERGEKLFYFLVRYFIPKQVKSHLNRFVDTFYKDFPRIRKLILPLIVGSFTWIIIFSQEYIIVLGLGVEIPYLYFLLLFPIANTVSFIPITFAGLGTRELTAIFLFSTLFAVAETDVFVFTLVGFIITDLLTGFIGFLLSLTEARKSISFN